MRTRPSDGVWRGGDWAAGIRLWTLSTKSCPVVAHQASFALIPTSLARHLHGMDRQAVDDAVDDAGDGDQCRVTSCPEQQVINVAKPLSR
jgi:hypothetical protein